MMKAEAQNDSSRADKHEENASLQMTLATHVTGFVLDTKKIQKLLLKELYYMT
jgi:hypothetical protein